MVAPEDSTCTTATTITRTRTTRLTGRAPPERWKHDGVRVIPGDRLDANTAQTPGMFRQAAINAARVGAQKIWAGTVAIQPDAKTGVHHHGDLESVIYVVSGRARMRWGERLEFVAEAGPGDFIFVPPYVPHQEINASTDEPLHCVLVRSDNEAVVVNLPDVDGRRDSPRRSTGSIRSTSIRKRPAAAARASAGAASPQPGPAPGTVPSGGGHARWRTHDCRGWPPSSSPQP